jgi:surface polysaccharide O-acyltransferase-like enzyme
MSINTETTAPIVAEKPLTGKVVYIDHLKVLLTVLVVLHHTFITYGAPGGWYFQQKTTVLAAQFPMTVFVATNQSFFMGFFFFLSALFIGPSLQKKGTAKFLADRLKRLGIPLIFYSLVFSPVLIYIVERFGKGQHYSFLEFISGFTGWIDFGVLWFVAALLTFTFIYLLLVQTGLKISRKVNLPNNFQLLTAGFLLGVFTFLTRLAFPTGWILKPLGFQLGHFPEYIFMFIVGIIASKNNWLAQLNYRQGKNLRWFISPMILLVLPAMFVIYLKFKFPISDFNGGWNPIALAYSLWEQMTGLAIMMALLSIAKFKWNNASSFLSRLSANAFAVYIFHPLAIIGISILVKDLPIDPAFKLLFVAPLAVVTAFVLAGLIRKIPFVKAII